VVNQPVLTAEGRLTFPRSEEMNGTAQEEPEEAETLEPGTFCLVEGFTIEELSGRIYESEELTAVYCDTCLSQVTCTYAQKLYQATGPERDNTFFVADTDGNGMVDFEEFHSKLKEYIEVVFNAFDSNNDGSIYDEAIGGNIFKRISLNLFESVVGQVIDFFDSNQDDTISIDDSFIQQNYRYQFLRRNGQEVTLMDMLGTSFISLPAPLYNLYSHLDRNKDEALSRDEASDFIRRIFSVIDTNSDCHIDSDEVVAMLARFEVPWDQQLAVKMLMEQYLSLVSYIVKTFVEQADMNNLNIVTMEEVINFNDFEFIGKVIETSSLWIPDGALSHLIPPHWAGRRLREATVAMWLTALQVTPGMPPPHHPPSGPHGGARPLRGLARRHLLHLVRPGRAGPWLLFYTKS
jgi:Ca2+-binding EF-hand superfamily protein